MNFLNYQLSNVNKGDEVHVTLDKQAYVRLMDEANYYKYKAGGQYKFYGGKAEKSPITITVPHHGKWYVIVDLGGLSGQVRASVNVTKN